MGNSRIQIASAEELLPWLREKLRALETTLTVDVAMGRLALGELLGNPRLRVYRDGRIEGALMLRSEILWVPKQTPGPTVCLARDRIHNIPETWFTQLAFGESPDAVENV
jgi:hypothetical protein